MSVDKNVAVRWTLVALGLLVAFSCRAQLDIQPLTKVGAFIYPGSYWVQIGFEREKVFTKKPRFTHGLRVDYESLNHNLIPGYQLKVYPFYNKSRVPYKGFFLGADACFFLKTNAEGLVGPGSGFLLGYQWRIGSRSALSFETNSIFMHNYGEGRVDGIYFWGLTFLKFGYQIGKSQ
jgi:hypothetical protein